MTKYDFKKELKEIYKAKKLSIIDVPFLHYISLKGTGNPNSKLFSDKVEALYATAYAISMSYKKDDFHIKDFFPFVVPPLEGVWDTIDNKEYTGDKDNLKYTIMLAMPSFVTEDVLKKAKDTSFKKKKNEYIKDIEMISYKERTNCIHLHLGSYNDEPNTFKEMMDFIKKEGYQRLSSSHREIYISDPRKTEEEKLKTILCFDIKK